MKLTEEFKIIGRQAKVSATSGSTLLEIRTHSTVALTELHIKKTRTIESKIRVREDSIDFFGAEARRRLLSAASLAYRIF